MFTAWALGNNDKLPPKRIGGSFLTSSQAWEEVQKYSGEKTTQLVERFRSEEDPFYSNYLVGDLKESQSKLVDQVNTLEPGETYKHSNWIGSYRVMDSSVPEGWAWGIAYSDPDCTTPFQTLNRGNTRLSDNEGSYGIWGWAKTSDWECITFPEQEWGPAEVTFERYSFSVEGRRDVYLKKHSKVPTLVRYLKTGVRTVGPERGRERYCYLRYALVL
jgi:hypothetical protein